MIRRIIVMAFGFVLAVGVSAIFLLVAALLDPATREAGFEAAMSGVFAIIDDDLRGGGLKDPLTTFGVILWAIVIATCAAPLAIAALIGEIAGARTLLWYSGVSATLAGASPWIVRAAKGLGRAREASPLELRIALLFFLTGALSGAIYWLIAAPSEPRPAQMDPPLRQR
ncbi:MAG: hypothetical protein FJX48_02105 [Alphaproteobacteria bacterium]|nr:hypothetical protein [Alphaproteobacteria bacterium]